MYSSIRPGSCVKHNITKNVYFVISSIQKIDSVAVYLLSSSYKGWWTIRNLGGWTQII